VNSPTARSGEAAALGQDLIDLADALGISVLKVAGHDKKHLGEEALGLPI
jgi:hypothetical protein